MRAVCRNGRRHVAQAVVGHLHRASVAVSMQGILVHGSNHFIVNGPLPSARRARALVRQWEIPELGAPPPDTDVWSICTKALRENLRWAVVLRSDSTVTAAVAALLEESRSRGIAVHEASGPWLPECDDAEWRGFE